MIVISNTTPLIGLSIVNKSDLLRVLFEEIVIPSSVYDEIVIKGAGRFGSAEIINGIAAGWIHVESAEPTTMLSMLEVDLDKGEAEAIALAIEKHADLLLLDERKARAKAQALGLEFIGTIGVLLLAREKGLEIELQSMLERLRSQGFRISDSLIKQILKNE